MECVNKESETNYIETFYADKDESNRFKTQHGKVEYLTTMHYINQYLYPYSGYTVAEIGAGTGAYSFEIASMGHTVTAVDLLDKHVEILKSRADTERLPVTVIKGNAVKLDLPDSEFDMVLLLGPMYHLFTVQEQRAALREACRICKPNGVIFIAYCLQDATIFNFLFREKHISAYTEHYINHKDYSLINNEKEFFNLYRIPDIDRLLRNLDVTMEHRIASDGLTNYARSDIDALSKIEFAEYMQWHFATCERSDMIGCSHHLLDIVRKTFY